MAFAAVWLFALVVLFAPTTPGGSEVLGADKAVHLGLFVALATTTRWRFGRGLPAVLVFAALSEVLQSALPIHRDGSLADLAADVVGAALGWWWIGRHPKG